MRALRTAIALSLAAVLVGAYLIGPAGAGPAKAVYKVADPKGPFKFGKPVSMTSSGPLRTAVGTVYTAERNGQASSHEWSGEPSIQIDDDGVIYIAGTCCVGAAAPVWYSTDGGKKFKEMETPGHAREWGVGAEGDLAVDHDGHVWFVDTYIPGLLTTRWSDHGATWDFTSPTAGTVPGFDDRPWLAYSKDALYLYVNHVSHTAVYRSTDGGTTWDGGTPLQWKGDPTGQPFFPAHLAANEETGKLWVTGVVSDNGKSVLGSAVGDYVGGVPVFKEAIVSPPQRRGGFSPIFTGATAVDAAGNGYTTWSTYDENGCDVYYAVSTDEGKSWHKPVKVNTGPGCATFPWITAGDDGKIALAWYQTPYTSAQGGQTVLAPTAGTTIYNGLHLPVDASQDSVPEDAPWYLYAAAITSADSDKPHVYGTRIDTKTPVLTGPLGRELWDFLQLDIGPDGRVHVAFVKKYHDSAPQTWYVGSTAGPKLK